MPTAHVLSAWLTTATLWLCLVAVHAFVSDPHVALTASLTTATVISSTIYLALIYLGVRQLGNARSGRGQR